MALFHSFPRSLGALTTMGVCSLLWPAGAGCSSADRDFNASGGGGGQGGGTGTGGMTGSGGSGGMTATTGSGGTAGTGGTGGAGGAQPLVCMPGMPPYDGPLCGPPSLPCKLLADEMVNDPHFRNDAPSIAVNGDCRPEILYSIAEGGFFGYHATRDAPDIWTVVDTPFEFATGALAIAPDGNSFILQGKGEFWMRSQGQWFQLQAIPTPSVVAGARSLGLDSAGNLHAGFYEFMNYASFYAVHASGWTVTNLADKISQRFPIAVSSTNQTHFAYWRSGMGWELRWSAPPQQAPEVIDTIGNSLSIANLGLAVTPPDPGNSDGQPHILYARPVPGMQVDQIVYATRTGPTFWDKKVIDEEIFTGAEFCSTQPMNLGETCDFNFEEVRPFGVIANAAGQVRLFYQKVHRMGTYVSDCPGGPPLCFWAPQTENSTGELRIAWIEPNQSVGTAAVADKWNGYGATMVLDTIGHIHVAGYVRDPMVPDDPGVRYLQIGP